MKGTNNDLFRNNSPVISQKVAQKLPKNNQKLLFVRKVAQKLLETNKNFFDLMLKYGHYTTKVRFLSISMQFCGVTSVAK